MFEGFIAQVIASILAAIVVFCLGFAFRRGWERFAKRRRLKNDLREYEDFYRGYEDFYKKQHAYNLDSCVGMKEGVLLDDVYVVTQVLDAESKPEYESLKSGDAKGGREQENKNLSGSSSGNRLDGLRIATEKKYLMVLGDAGVGKTTFLRKVGLEAFKGTDRDFRCQYIPVFLELKGFPENEINIEAEIIKVFKRYRDPDSKANSEDMPNLTDITNATLDANKFILLFDGLDEVPTANVSNVISAIGEFVDQYYENRFIISSRTPMAIRTKRPFIPVRIAPFTDKQIYTYIKKWFNLTPNQHSKQLDEETETAKQCREKLEVPQHRTTKSLVQYPLLLTYLCVIYNELQDLPQNRAGFYTEIIDIFLKKLPTQKAGSETAYINRDSIVGQSLSTSQVKQLLSEIAAKHFGKSLLFEKTKLVTQIKKFCKRKSIPMSEADAEKLLESMTIESGILVQTTMSGFYSLLHPTFHEYLTANYFVSTESIQRLVSEHLHDKQWREVFLFAAGLLPEADDLLTAMETEAAKLINTDRLKSLFRWAERITDTTDSQYSGRAKRTFAIHKYLPLCLQNRVHETIKNNNNRDSQDFDFDLDLDFDRYFNHYRYQDLSGVSRGFHSSVPLDLIIIFGLSIVEYPDRDLVLYLERSVSITPMPLASYALAYHDCYRYINTDSHAYEFYEFGHKFDEDLAEWIKFVRRIKDAKIFKGVDLDRMIQRFYDERKFIKTAREKVPVEPPSVSIHDTWLSVLGVTDDMLDISNEELESCLQYLRAVEFIIACKEEARCVSPKVWQEIENRLLVADTAESED